MRLWAKRMSKEGDLHHASAEISRMNWKSQGRKEGAQAQYAKQVVNPGHCSYELYMLAWFLGRDTTSQRYPAELSLGA